MTDGIQKLKANGDAQHYYHFALLLTKIGVLYSLSRGGNHSTDEFECFSCVTHSEYTKDPESYDAEWRWAK